MLPGAAPAPQWPSCPRRRLARHGLMAKRVAYLRTEWCPPAMPHRARKTLARKRNRTGLSAGISDWPSSAILANRSDFSGEISIVAERASRDVPDARVAPLDLQQPQLRLGATWYAENRSPSAARHPGLRAGVASRLPRCPELYRRQRDRRFESLVLHWRKADATAETLPFCPAHLLFLILF